MLDLSPAQIFLLYQTSRQGMAEQAVLNMDAVFGATALGWLKDGKKMYDSIRQRLLTLAGVGESQQKPKQNDPKTNRQRLAEKLKSMGAKQR